MESSTLFVAICLLFLALPASASGDDHDEHEHATPMYSNGWRAWFGYTIPAAGEYHIKIRGKSCKNSFLNLVALNAESTMDEHLEETASKYFNHTYPFNMASTYAGCTFKSWGDSGTCSRIIVQQNSSMEEPKTKYDAVALTSNEAAISTVPFFQLQFNTSDSEACTNMAAGTAVDAHAAWPQPPSLGGSRTLCIRCPLDVLPMRDMLELSPVRAITLKLISLATRKTSYVPCPSQVIPGVGGAPPPLGITMLSRGVVF